MKNIAVVNALNGVFALAIRKKYPDAKITCLEYFPFYQGHLNRLGFEVIDWKDVDGMKFDLIVGNPPYQDSDNKAKNNKLWHKFVRKITELTTDSGYISLVTPSSVFNKTVGFGKWFTETLLADYRLVDAQVHPDKKYFTVGVQTCHWTVTKNPADSRSVPVPHLRDPIIDTILDKVSSHPDRLNLQLENPHITKADFGQGTTEIYYSGKNKTTVATGVTNPSNLKIVFPFSAKYETQFVTTEPTGHFNRVLYVKNQQEADNVLTVTQSKLVRFYAHNFQKTAGFTPAVKNSRLPKLDSTKAWSDQEIYEFFGLSAQEIQVVEEFF